MTSAVHPEPVPTSGDAAIQTPIGALIRSGSYGTIENGVLTIHGSAGPDPYRGTRILDAPDQRPGLLENRRLLYKAQEAWVLRHEKRCRDEAALTPTPPHLYWTVGTGHSTAMTVQYLSSYAPTTWHWGGDVFTEDTCATWQEYDLCDEPPVLPAPAREDPAWQAWNGQYWARVVEEALTEDQRVERDRRLRRMEEDRLRANERAKALFLAFLTDEQRQEYARSETVTVRSQHSGTRYQVNCSLRDGRHGNIKELDVTGKNVVASLCCAPEGNIPHFDAVLGQIVALQFDEMDFRRAANFTPLIRNYQRERRAA